MAKDRDIGSSQDSPSAHVMGWRSCMMLFDTIHCGQQLWPSVLVPAYRTWLPKSMIVTEVGTRRLDVFGTSREDMTALERSP